MSAPVRGPPIQRITIAGHGRLRVVSADYFAVTTASRPRVRAD
jgi:hypothetical protein